MRTITAGMLALAAVAGAACNDDSSAPAGASYSASGLAASSTAGGAREGFGFNGTVSGFPTGAVFLTGGGSFDAATGVAELFLKDGLIVSVFERSEHSGRTTEDRISSGKRTHPHAARAR